MSSRSLASQSSITRKLAAVTAAVVGSAVLLAAAPVAAADVPHVLVFSATYGFRHPSITHGNEVIQELSDSTGAFTVEFTELITDLAPSNLRDVDLLLFNSTTGRFPLTAAGRDGLERYWGCGGGFVGIHAAADANYGWPEYAEMVGAQFDAHPHTGNARLLVENADHPVNAPYAEKTDWAHSDEYYRWIRDVRGTQDVVPLLSLDETTARNAYVDDQPLSWVKSFRQRGRVFYNNLGHNDATWNRAEFKASLVEGVKWVSQVSLNTACFDGTEPLPTGPAAPAPDPDPEAPKDPCVLKDGQVRLTPAGLTQTASHPPAPAYFTKFKRTYVLDLSGDPRLSADVGVKVSWPVPVDDYDLAVSSPWGFAGSDAIQPAFESFESARVEDALHCTPIDVSVFNHAAVTQQAPSVSLTVDGPVDPSPPLRVPVPSKVPGSTATVTAAPGGTVTGFAPTKVAVTEGGSLTFLNADPTIEHNIACAEFDPVTLRPRCESTFGEVGHTAPVTGVNKLPPGTYGLYCQLHPQMTSELTVVDTP